MTTDFHVDNLVVDTINGSEPLVSPATTKGDLLVENGAPALARLAVGADLQVLTADSGQALGVKWANAAGFANPMITSGDLIAAGAAGVAQRLAIGTNGFVLTVVAGAPAWVAAFTNPMSAKGDLIAGGSAGAATRLPVGTNGQTLVADSAQTLGVRWATPSSSGGNPPAYNPQTGTTYALALTDAPSASSSQGIVSMSNAAANVVTVPPHSSVAWVGQTMLQVIQLGAGQTSIAAGAGVTILTAASLHARTVNSTLLLTYLGSDVWTLSGDLA